MSLSSTTFNTKNQTVLERFHEKGQGDRARDFSRPITLKDTNHIYEMNLLRAEGQSFNEPLANGVVASKQVAQYGHHMDGTQFVGDEWQYLPRPLCCPPQETKLPGAVLY